MMSKVNFFVIFVVFQVISGLVDAALRLDNESELREAQAALFNVNTQSGWLLLNYVGPNTVHFTAGGEGGIGDVVPHLEDDQIQYVLVRESINDHEIRDVFIAWIGPSVGVIEKGKKTAQLGDAQSFLQPYNAAITALSKENLNDETVIDRSNPLSGSHVID